MMQDGYQKLYELETTPEALEATVDYLARLIKPFLQTLEPVLICYPDEGPTSLGGIFRDAVLRCDAMPVFWEGNYRWKDLLRIAFETHANTLIGNPLVILGLIKLAKTTGTPLYFYDVIACGEPFPRWIVNGLKKGLDCNAWGCYAVNSGPVIGGFSCMQEAGIHIREDVFRPILQHGSDDQVWSNWGRLYLASAKDPDLIYDPCQNARLQYQQCSCGCDEVRVVEVCSCQSELLTEEILQEQLLAWSSILDYRATYTESGLNLELVVFPGELLPELPNCAKLVVRTWDPEKDVPFFVEDTFFKIPENSL